MSHEKIPGWLGYFLGDEILPNYSILEDYVINHWFFSQWNFVDFWDAFLLGRQGPIGMFLLFLLGCQGFTKS